MLTYSDLSGDDIPRPTDLTAWRRELFGRYVERMLQHQPGTEAPQLDYAEEAFQRTSAWLDYELQVHSEGTFYLEHLQMDWLPDAATQRRYRQLQRLIPLVGGLASAASGGSARIEPVARLGFSWAGARVGLYYGLGAGLVYGLVAGLGSGLVFGLTSALGGGPGGGLIAGLFFGLTYGQAAGLIAVLIAVLVEGLISWLATGGRAALQHLALRRVLRQSGVVPPGLVRFLDEACALVLLRRIGGGVSVHPPTAARLLCRSVRAAGGQEGAAPAGRA